MARIDREQHELEAPETVATLASLGLMLCMVVTLVGIKIWWFKHRLSFDQSSTSNGAAGGTQPRIVTRSRSSKDKRLSQQFREPVLVHGVFRKRQEDELETFERPKLLPPIRQRKLSQSTPELFQPSIRPALGEAAEHDVIDIPAPPKREPPAPPTRQAPPPPTFKEIEAIPITSTPLKEEQDVKAVEFDSSEEEEEEEEIIKVVTPDVKVEPAPTPKAPRPLQRNRSYNLEGMEHRFLRAKTASFEKCKPNINLIERRATGFQRPNEMEWQKFEEDELDYGTDDRTAKNHRREEGQLRKWEDLESYSYEMLNLEQHRLDKPQIDNKNMVIQVVDAVDEYEEEQEHYSTWTLKRRQATGFTNGAPMPLTDLDCTDEDPQQQSQQCLDESDKLWQEMERDVDRDFSINIEEEFNKIRHSYEANEEGFLEESTNELDTGYGKSIDEDWESFESLEHSDSKIGSQALAQNLRVIKVDLLESDESLETSPQHQKVHFKLNDDYKEDASDKETKSSSSSKIRQRRPTGFLRSSKELKQAELVGKESANEMATGRTHKVSFQLSEEEELESNQEEEESILKQRRPTGYVKREDYTNLQLDTDDDEGEGEEEDIKVKKLKADAIIKAKPRQKVTFNFATEVREHEIDEILTDDETNNEQPKPMQRITKINNNNNHNDSTTTENSAALLFSTQVSAEYATADEGCTDSWSAIRLHRQLTDEFQQLTTREKNEEGASAPKAAYRNPLAQLDAGNRAEDFSIVAKPRTMRDMKKTQARQTMHVEHYDGSATEA